MPGYADASLSNAGDRPQLLPPLPPKFPIFNNWNIVANGWYVVCRSQEIPVQKAQSFSLCGRRIVLFRGMDGKVRALDAYCPHMGTDLGIGSVEGNQIRCFFHHWAFSESGQCQDIPCQSSVPQKARISAYATAEKYGLIWIYPEAKAPESVPEFDELKGKSVVVSLDKAFERRCHHHICMMNGIDAQHLRTVHGLNVDMTLDIDQNLDPSVIDFTMSGELPATQWKERLGRRVLGKHYSYSMRYVNGCVGLLTMMKQVRVFPPLHLIYAYTPIAPGRTRIQPIYVTAKRPGLWGKVVSYWLLLCTRLMYYMLRDEDGKVYDHIRFNPQHLLPIDRPIVTYMNYVNQLTPSRWSMDE